MIQTNLTTVLVSPLLLICIFLQIKDLHLSALLFDEDFLRSFGVPFWSNVSFVGLQQQ